jgi:Leucine-rich repeat (LRR) protein
MPTIVTQQGPGTWTINDDAAAAIIAQTAAVTSTMTSNNTLLIAELTFIDSAINQININVGKLVDRSALISKAISDLDATTSVSVSSQNTMNVLQATAIANQIKTNNFQMAATKEALERTGQPVPVLPDFQEQIKEGVTDAVNLNIASTVQGAGLSFLNSTLESTASLIAGTETYKGISAWLTKQKDVILSAILPPSASTVASAGAAASGVKTIVSQ